MAEAAFINVVTEVAKGLVTLVAARAFDEINLALGVKDQLLKLQRKFEFIQAFLEDASNAKYAQKSERVKLWVQKVKDAAYMADDVMDEYAIESFRMKMELKNSCNRKFRNFFTLSNPVFFRFRMAHKVNEILALFSEIKELAKEIGLSSDVFAANTSATVTSNDDHNLSQIREYAAASASEFVGRVEDEVELLNFICSSLTEERHLSTVAIVGMGGSLEHIHSRRRFQVHIISENGINAVRIPVGWWIAFMSE